MYSNEKHTPKGYALMAQAQPPVMDSHIPVRQELSETLAERVLCQAPFPGIQDRDLGVSFLMHLGSQSLS